MTARKPRQDPNDGSHWTLDRRVPLALVLALLLQAAAILTWANTITSKVSNIEEDVRTLKIESKERSQKPDKLPILETELRHIGTAIARLESTLEKLNDAYVNSQVKATSHTRTR